jgi:hypothetical protein
MSLESLRNMGLLRDEAHWDGSRRASGVPVAALLAAAIIGAGGCAAMAAGDGGWISWVGVGGFLAGLAGVIAANLRGVTGGRPPRAS